MPFRNEKTKPRETAKYYSGAGKPRTRSSVLEVLFSEKSYAAVVQGESRVVNGLASVHPGPQDAKKAPGATFIMGNWFSRANKQAHETTRDTKTYM